MGGTPQRLQTLQGLKGLDPNPLGTERAVPPCLRRLQILQGGREACLSHFFPVGRFEPEAVLRHFKAKFLLGSFELVFWRPETIEK